MKYSPQWAPHVEGEFEPTKTNEEGAPEPNLVRIKCNVCGATHQVKCMSGAPRQWVLKFATVHAHRDPFAPLPKKESKP